MKFFSMSLFILVIILLPSISLADWQIDQSAYINWLCSQPYAREMCSQPSRVGTFATKADCERERAKMLNAPYWDQRYYNLTRCVGYDSPSSSGGYSDSLSPSLQERIEEYNRRMEKVREMAAKGNRAYSNRDWPEAIKYYKEALKLGPSIHAEPVIRQNLKNAELQYEQYKKSVIKLSIAEKAKNTESINELSCIAHWSLLAANAASSGAIEEARKYAGYGFDDFIKEKGCPPINVYVPRVTTSVEANPQYKAYKYVIERINTIYPEMISTNDKLREIQNSLADITIRKHDIFSKKVESRSIEERNQLQKEEDDLEKIARELYKEASEMREKAQKQHEEVVSLRKELNKLDKNPEYSVEFIKNISTKNEGR